ncbi:hypothetical protein ABT255_61755 [Streptomyces mirabilis]|uniref:MmyB family transcriptional regulator n=1 Tax=Streptomyces mirabilis TaxID=68239 RepID=UPI00331DB918
MLAAFGSRRSPKAASTACTDPAGATPAFVVNYRQIISNRLSRTLITDVDALPNRRRNIARFVLLDPGRPRPAENWAEVVRRQRHPGRGQGHCCHSAVDAGRASRGGAVSAEWPWDTPPGAWARRCTSWCGRRASGVHRRWTSPAQARRSRCVSVRCSADALMASHRDSVRGPAGASRAHADCPPGRDAVRRRRPAAPHVPVQLFGVPGRQNTGITACRKSVMAGVDIRDHGR